MKENNISELPIELARDYEMLCKWWEKRRFPCPPKEVLAPTGLLIFYGKDPICAGFLMKTDTTVASIGNLISDVDLPGVHRKEALGYLLDRLVDLASQSGYTIIAAATNLERLMQRYRSMGFTETDTDVSQFAGRIA